MTKQNIIIGSDHGGYHLKETVKHWLEMNGFTVTDVGCDSSESVDYPVYACEVAQRVSRGEFPQGILICGTGIGMSMAANKYRGIRAALCNDLFCATHSRAHNDANILVMGGRILGSAYALAITKEFMNTKFDGGRHRKRVDQIMKAEEKWGKK